MENLCYSRTVQSSSETVENIHFMSVTSLCSTTNQEIFWDRILTNAVFVTITLFNYLNIRRMLQKYFISKWKMLSSQKSQTQNLVCAEAFSTSFLADGVCSFVIYLTVNMKIAIGQVV